MVWSINPTNWSRSATQVEARGLINETKSALKGGGMHASHSEMLRKATEGAYLKKAEQEILQELERPGFWESASHKMAAPGRWAKGTLKTAAIVGGVAIAGAYVANMLGGKAKRERDDAAFDAEREAINAEMEEMKAEMNSMDQQTMMGMPPQPGQFAARVRGGGMEDPAMQPNMTAGSFDVADDGKFAARARQDAKENPYGLAT